MFGLQVVCCNWGVKERVAEVEDVGWGCGKKGYWQTSSFFPTANVFHRLPGEGGVFKFFCFPGEVFLSRGSLYTVN